MIVRIRIRINFNMVIKMTAHTKAACMGFQIFASWMQHKQADGAIPNT